jgi:DNA-binding transcriptional ArsR family regulator
MVRGCASLGIVLLLGCSQRSVSVDAAAADAGKPDTGPLPAGCQALAGFAGGVRIADLPAAQALFSASLDRVVLVTKPSAGYGDLVDVALPGGEATTTLEQGVVQAEWLGSGPELLVQKPLSTDPAAARDLVVVSAVGGGSSSVAKGVCGHLAAPDGKRVYVVRSCVDGAGTLELVDLATGSAKQLGTGVDAGSLAVAADGQHAAFVAEVESTSGCTQPRGTAYLADPGGTTTSLAADTLVKSLQFLADGKLLLGVMKTCGGYAFQLTVADPADGSLQPVGSEHHYGTQGYFSRPRYAVSADGALVLGAGADLAEIQYELYGVAVDGSAETLLAGDLYPYMTVSAVYEAWAFAPGGVHVVYTPVLNPGQSPPRIGLASVTVPGGKRVLLSMDLQLPSHRGTTRSLCSSSPAARTGSPWWRWTPRPGSSCSTPSTTSRRSASRPTAAVCCSSRPVGRPTRCATFPARAGTPGRSARGSPARWPTRSIRPAARCCSTRTARRAVLSSRCCRPTLDRRNGPAQGGPMSLADEADRAARIADVLKALAHPLRLRLVAVLCEGNQHVTGLAERLGVTQPLVSQQLRILRMRGLVEARTESGRAVYRLAEPRLPELIACLGGCRAAH